MNQREVRVDEGQGIIIRSEIIVKVLVSNLAQYIVNDLSLPLVFDYFSPFVVEFFNAVFYISELVSDVCHFPSLA